MKSLSRISALLTIFAIAALPGLKAGPIALNISEAQDFNLLVWNNATLLNSDIEGRAAVGGNASFNSYSIGTHITGGTALDGAFVVGGNLTAGHGQVYNGSIYVGGTYAGPGYNLNSAPSSVTQSNLGAAGLPFDFAAAQAALTAKSQTFGAALATGDSDVLWSTLTFTGTDTNLNIFNIDALTLASVSSLVLDVTAGSHVLINVSGTSANFSSMGLAGFDSNNTLFNFFEASSLSMSGIGVIGSILAPYADVNFISGQMNGQLVAKSFGSSGELHSHFFNNQAEPPVSVPDTASTALLLALGLLGLPLVRRFTQANRR